MKSGRRGLGRVALHSHPNLQGLGQSRLGRGSQPRWGYSPSRGPKPCWDAGTKLENQGCASADRAGAQHANPDPPPSPRSCRGQGAPLGAWMMLCRRGYTGGAALPPRPIDVPPSDPIGMVKGELSRPGPQKHATTVCAGSGGAGGKVRSSLTTASERAPLAHKQRMGLAGIILLFPTPLSRGE